MRREKQEKLSKSAASGMVALVFLVLGFQLALFVVKVVERSPVEPGLTSPVGPGVTEEPPAAEAGETAGGMNSRNSGADASGTPRTKLGGYARPDATKPARTCESFPFDPNTVSLADLQRLGLSERQAGTIGHYREKGGRFRSAADFQKMYVVSDTLFARLEPYITIAKLELNTADSAALVTLPGIGPYYARKILDYRERLGGFCDKAQLLEIDGFGTERYEGLADAVTADAGLVRRLDLWQAPDSVLARHPYLGARWARSLVRYRQLCDSAGRTLSALERERVLPLENIEKLKNYIENQ